MLYGVMYSVMAADHLSRVQEGHGVPIDGRVQLDLPGDVDMTRSSESPESRLFFASRLVPSQCTIIIYNIRSNLIRLFVYKMNKFLLAIVAAMAVAVVSAEESMNGYFMADLKNADGEMTGAMNASLQEGVWNWIMTSDFPVESVEIVDRKGSALEPEFRGIVDIAFGSSENGTYEGTFDNAAVDTSNTPYLFKDERNMTNAHQLAGHMCMGHIFAVVNGTDGVSSYGALMYMGDGEDDCYAGTGTESMRMKMDMDMDMGGEATSSSGMDMDMGGEATPSSEMDMDMGGEAAGSDMAAAASSAATTFSTIGMIMFMIFM